MTAPSPRRSWLDRRAARVQERVDRGISDERDQPRRDAAALEQAVRHEAAWDDPPTRQEWRRRARLTALGWGATAATGPVAVRLVLAHDAGRHLHQVDRAVAQVCTVTVVLLVVLAHRTYRLAAIRSELLGFPWRVAALDVVEVDALRMAYRDELTWSGDSERYVIRRGAMQQQVPAPTRQGELLAAGQPVSGRVVLSGPRGGLALVRVEPT